MDKQAKIFEVDNLKAKIEGAKAVAVADFRGINVSQISQLREKVRETGGELQVVKNTLFLRALKALGFQNLEEKCLAGPSLVLFANTDEIAPLKALAGFAKTISLLPFKFGFMAKELLSAEQLSKFATLPGKSELQAKLIGLLASQPTRLAYALNYNIQKLVIALNGVKNKKQ